MSEPNTNNIDAMSREDLIARARELSINRPELMTRIELRDEIIRLTETDEERRKRARGWLGVARDLVASVVEQRLNLPDAAELIRGANLGVSRHVPPVATVTLAEIYAAQGHLARAIRLLDEVLLREPDHAAAAALRANLIEQQAASKTAEPAVRQSDMPEPHDVSEPWDGDPITSESADAAPAEAEAMAAAEEAVESQSTLVELEAVSEVSGIASVVSATYTDDASEPGSNIEEPFVMSPGDEVIHTSELPLVDPQVPSDEPSEELDLDTGSRVTPDEPGIDGASEAVCDELLLYRRNGAALVCHWELQCDTWEEWQARRDGEWVLRVFQVKATEGPLEFEENDVSLPGMSGEVLLEIEQPAHVRLAVGWKSGGHFQPIAIGVEIAGEPPEQLHLAWCPLPSASDPPTEFWLQQASRCWPALSVSGG